jgi:hypothetical protein
MFEKIGNYIREYFFPVVIFGSGLVLVYFAATTKPNVETLKDYKDGIQNHLTWSIKGECFFVRPHTDQTVYLIRVTDCDKK